MKYLLSIQKLIDSLNTAVKSAKVKEKDLQNGNEERGPAPQGDSVEDVINKIRGLYVDIKADLESRIENLRKISNNIPANFMMIESFMFDINICLKTLKQCTIAINELLNGKVPLSPDEKEQLLKMLDSIKETIQSALASVKETADNPVYTKHTLLRKIEDVLNLSEEERNYVEDVCNSLGEELKGAASSFEDADIIAWKNYAAEELKKSGEMAKQYALNFLSKSKAFVTKKTMQAKEDKGKDAQTSKKEADISDKNSQETGSSLREAVTAVSNYLDKKATKAAEGYKTFCESEQKKAAAEELKKAVATVCAYFDEKASQFKEALETLNQAEQAMNSESVPIDEDERAAIEKVVDDYLGEALDSLDEGEYCNVQHVLLSMKPALREISSLFKPEEDVKENKTQHKHAVVVTYSFDNTVRVIEAANYQEAYDYMRTDFLNEKRIDTEENGYELGEKTEIGPTSATLETIYPNTGRGCTYWTIESIEKIPKQKKDN